MNSTDLFSFYQYINIMMAVTAVLSFLLKGLAYYSVFRKAKRSGALGFGKSEYIYNRKRYNKKHRKA